MGNSELLKAITARLHDRGEFMHIRMANVFVGPWESDVICVRPSLHWVEYEIKMSKQDLQADFRKRARGRIAGDFYWINKHHLYAGEYRTHPVSYFRHQHPFAVPRQFFFVVPEGLVTESPAEHAGWIEFNTEGRTRLRHPAPVLRNCQKLSARELFVLAGKATI